MRWGWSCCLKTKPYCLWVAHSVRNQLANAQAPSPESNKQNAKVNAQRAATHARHRVGPAQTTEAPPEKESLEGAVRWQLHRDPRRSQRLFLSRHLADPAPGRRPALLRLRDRPRSARRCRSAPMSAPGAATSISATPAPSAEIDLIAGLRLKRAGRQADLRPGLHPLQLPRRAPRTCSTTSTSSASSLGYDFGVAQIQGAVRYSPNFFGNSGNARYKWGQVTVPMPFLYFNENFAFKPLRRHRQPVCRALHQLRHSRQQLLGLADRPRRHRLRRRPHHRLYRHQPRRPGLPRHPELRRPRHRHHHQDVLIDIMNKLNHLLMTLLPLELKLKIVSREVRKEMQYQAI